MNEKHREVNVWLERMFGGDAMPQYEVDTFTIDRLYHLMKKNEENDKFANSILEDMQEKTEEYQVEADRLSGVMDKVGLLPGVLSQSGAGSLRALANSAVILEVPVASDTNLLLATSELSQQCMQVAEERRMEQRSTAQLFSKTKAARIQTNNLERALTSLEEQARNQGPDLQGKAKQASFLTTKAKEYERHIQDLQKELLQNKVDPTVYHSALVKKSEELKVIKDELAGMKSRLNSYHQLPPDMALARVKVEETKLQLEQVEEELTKRINLMHM